MDGGELVLAIQLLQSTQTMTCFHTASTVCTLATMLVSLSSREMGNMKPGQIPVIIRTSHSFHLSQPPNAGFYGDTGSLKIVSAPINLLNENIYMSIFCHVTVVKEYKSLIEISVYIHFVECWANSWSRFEDKTRFHFWWMMVQGVECCAIKNWAQLDPIKQSSSKLWNELKKRSNKSAEERIHDLKLLRLESFLPWGRFADQ